MRRRERLLGMLLAVSLCTNAVLVFRLHAPRALERLRLSFIPPPELRSDDHVRGEGGVLLIAYVDFECPYCRSLHETLATLHADGTRFRYVLRHYAARNLKPGSWRAALASECAAEQRSYWEMADRLYGSPEDHVPEKLLALATTLPLDARAFSACLAGESKAARVERDFMDAREQEVFATPTYFINGERHVGSMDATRLGELLRAASP